MRVVPEHEVENKCLDELGFVPNAVGKLLRVNNKCDKKCDAKKKARRLMILHSSMRKSVEMFRQKTSRSRLRASLGSRCTISKTGGSVHHQKKGSTEQLLEEEATAVQQSATWYNEPPFKKEFEFLRMRDNLRLKVCLRVKCSRKRKVSDWAVPENDKLNAGQVKL